MKKKFLNLAVLAVVLGLVETVSGQVLTYRFNEADGSTAVNSGSGGAMYNLTTVNAEGAPADLHSGKTSGVAGPDGSPSLDLSSAAGMGKDPEGKTFAGPSAYSALAGKVFDGAVSFTVTGWYRAKEAPRSSGARLFQTGNLFVFFSQGLAIGTSQGTVNSEGTVLGIGEVTGTSGTPFGDDCSEDGWMFFAVTYSYDASNQQNTAGFYLAEADPAYPLRSHNVSFSGKSLVTGNNSPRLVFGNNTQQGGSRPFRGALDNISIFVSSQDTSAALSADAIAKIRAAGKTNR